MQGIRNTARIIFEMVGKDGKNVYGKKEFLEKIARIDKEFAEQIEKGVEGVANPTFEISGKATADYNIASLKIKDAEGKVVGSGACSSADLLTRPTLKSRLDLPSGKSYRAGNTNYKNFVIKDSDGGISILDRYTGKVIAKNRVDTTVVDKKVTKDETVMAIDELNAKGKTVRRTALYANIDNGRIYVTKTLPDGSEISISGGPDYETSILSKDLFTIEYNNIFKNQNIYLSPVNRNGVRKLSFGEGENWLSIDKQQKVVETYALNSNGSMSAEEFNSLTGKQLTDELKEKLGVKEIFDSMKDIPTEEEFIKMALNFPDRHAGKIAAKRVTEKAAQKSGKKSAKVEELVPVSIPEIVSPETKTKDSSRVNHFIKTIGSVFKKEKNPKLNKQT